MSIPGKDLSGIFVDRYYDGIFCAREIVELRIVQTGVEKLAELWINVKWFATIATQFFAPFVIHFAPVFVMTSEGCVPGIDVVDVGDIF